MVGIHANMKKKQQKDAILIVKKKHKLKKGKYRNLSGQNKTGAEQQEERSSCSPPNKPIRIQPLLKPNQTSLSSLSTVDKAKDNKWDVH